MAPASRPSAMSQRSAFSSPSAIWLPRSTALPNASSNGWAVSLILAGSMFVVSESGAGCSDAGLGQRVEHGADRPGEPGMPGLEPDRRALEGIGTAGLPGGDRRGGVVERATNVRHGRLQQRPVARAELLGLCEFLVEVVHRLLEIAHGPTV